MLTGILGSTPCLTLLTWSAGIQKPCWSMLKILGQYATKLSMIILIKAKLLPPSWLVFSEWSFMKNLGPHQWRSSSPCERSCWLHEGPLPPLHENGRTPGIKDSKKSIDWTPVWRFVSESKTLRKEVSLSNPLSSLWGQWFRLHVHEPTVVFGKILTDSPLLTSSFWQS